MMPDVFNPSNYGYNLSAVPLVVAAFGAVGFGIVTWRRKRAALLTEPFLFLVSTIFVWFGTKALVLLSAEASIAYFWAKVGYLGICLIPAAVAEFWTTFLRAHRASRSFRGLLWALCVAVIPIALLGQGLLSGVYHYEWGYYSRYGALGIPFVIFFCGATVIAVVVPWAGLERKARPPEARRYLAWFAVAGVAVIDFPAAFGVPLHPLGYIPVLIFLFVAARGIQMHGVLDIRPSHVSRQVVETMEDALLVCDAGGKIQLTNHAVSSMFGFEPEEMIGRSLNLLVDPDTTLGHFTSLKKVLQDGVVRDQDRIFRHRSGELIDVSVSMSPLKKEEPGGVVVIVRDRRERVRAEEAVRTSEEKYRLLFERSLAGVYRSTLDGVLLECNQACARILGWSHPSEVLSRSIDDIYVDLRQRTEAIRMVQSAGSLPGMEFVLRRRDGSEVSVVESLAVVQEEGGDPYLQGTMVDISDQKRAEAQILYYVNHDVLTCLPNRTLFRDRMDVAVAQAERSGAGLAVLALDIDQFKMVNEIRGQTAGDELLVILAERLERALRRTDTLARIGGNEFNILLMDIESSSNAVRLAKKFQALVTEPFRMEGADLFLTASIGLALFPSDGADSETLLRSSGNALREAKQAGRGLIQLASSEMNRIAAQRTLVENRLHVALERKQFVLHYQPVVDVERGTIVGMESLVRWNDPDKGLLPPHDFIQVAEESHLILPLGEWVLREACRQAAVWNGEGRNWTVAVNLSLRQLRQPELVEMLQDVLRVTQLDPTMLELEVTETAAAHNVTMTVRILQQLRDLGVSVSIDDFGTGYSSLSHLKRFPITTLKIDQGFVRDLESGPGDVAIVNAMVALARELDLRIIAEGVETARQSRLLHRMGCRRMQGFLFSTPRPAETFSSPSEVSAILAQMSAAARSESRPEPPAEVAPERKDRETAC